MAVIKEHSYSYTTKKMEWDEFGTDLCYFAEKHLKFGRQDSEYYSERTGIEDQISRQRTALGKLLSILHRKQIINDEEFFETLDISSYDIGKKYKIEND